MRQIKILEEHDSNDHLQAQLGGMDWLSNGVWKRGYIFGRIPKKYSSLISDSSNFGHLWNTFNECLLYVMTSKP